MYSFNDFFPSHVRAYFSDKTCSFAYSEGNTLNEEQSHYISEGTDISPDSIIQLKQQHGCQIINMEAILEDLSHVYEGDALITLRENVSLAIRTADCLPIFIYDTKTSGIGLVHAGWKGTREYILKKTIRTINELWLTPPENVMVLFGPGIGKCCYEVGEEFKEYFPEEIFQLHGRLKFDLKAANKKQLFSVGVPEGNIKDCDICTCCHNDYFSYRRQGKDAGRHISIMNLACKEK